ncbi:Uncharacterised protein [[Clostridium] sordellii]|uniref:hypothetical protein n=1 Tax=Paraclostridium sordellii TaxID=1505 RepID=UPI0005E98418|nr:hypothetical protein [Paeniclostridium sordellii]CEO10752.1 Uncharacterised protein [[Clostridium] sordellii] [Paeniclostridium sordellii]
MGIKDKAKEIFDASKEPMFEMSCELFLEGAAGTLVPGAMGIYLSHKQKRQEKMFEKFMLEIKDRVQILENRLGNMSDDQFNEFKEKYFVLISDYIVEEVQEEKIKYLANGFINLAEIRDINEDFVLMYYDTMKELRIRDIGVLKFYNDLHSPFIYGDDKPNYFNMLKELDIDDEQYTTIREKLVRVGLFTTKRENKLDDLYLNILNMQNYLEDISKGKKSKLKSLKRLDKNDSFQISKFGREFIKFFIDEIKV